MKSPKTQRCNPLRVMLFDHIASMSGGEVALLNLVRHLDRRLVEPIVVLGEEGPLAVKLRPCAEVHILPMQAGFSKARKDSLGAKSLLSGGVVWSVATYVRQLSVFMRQHRIDLVHTNSLKADVLGGLAARLSGTPVVWHIRDRIADDYLPSTVVKVFKMLCRSIPNGIIAISYAVAAPLGGEKGKPKPLFVVHDGTEVEIFQAMQSARKPSDETVVGLVGRISPWKGQDIFLRAAHQLRDKYPKAIFRIIGAALFNEAEYEKSIHALASELDLNETVQFTGFRENIPAEIAQLDILVHASTRAEPFGQVIIEGMATARPVVATNGGGVPEIVDDGITGLLVPMEDADAMAAAIDSLLADPERARMMGQLGLQAVQERFTISKTARGVERVYRNMLGIEAASEDPDVLSSTLEPKHTPTLPIVGN